MDDTLNKKKAGPETVRGIAARQAGEDDQGEQYRETFPRDLRFTDG